MILVVVNQLTPFESLYGVPPPTRLQYVAGTTQNIEVESHLNSRDEILVILKRNLLTAQAAMKKK